MKKMFMLALLALTFAAGLTAAVSPTFAGPKQDCRGCK
jgi:hypothetical protein